MYVINLQRSPKFDIIATNLNSTQQPGGVFCDIFHSIEEILSKWLPTSLKFNYIPLWVMTALVPCYMYVELNMFQTLKMRAVKIVKWIIVLF